MSWVDILKKNDKEFEIILDTEIETYELPSLSFVDPNIKDLDDEFDRLYMLKIYDIKFYFKQVIDDYPLPFLNIKSNNNLLIDFIKYNCKNYYKLEKKIIKENDEYLEELKEEEEQKKMELMLEND